MASKMIEIKIKTAQAKPIVSKTFPNYKGRKFTVKFTDTVRFHDTNWSGGSHNEYTFVQADGTNAYLPTRAPWANPFEGKSVTLPTDVLVVEHSIFCGKDCGITIYANPTWLPKWLPE